MNTYNWTISSLEVKPVEADATNVVVTAHWRLDGTDGTHTAGVYGSQTMQPYEAGATFIPYDQLTQEIVVGWIESAMGEEQVQAHKDAIDGQIANLINPPVLTPPLPWVSAE